jgi:hypothetical protein
VLEQVTPLRSKKTSGRQRKSFISFLLNKKRGQFEVPVQKLSQLHPNLRLRGLRTKGGTNFADWFNAIPPDTHIDKEFTCDQMTKLTKDTFKNSSEYDEYLNISETI